MRHSRRFLIGSAAAFAAAGAYGQAKAAEFAFKCSSSQAVDHPASIRMKQMWAAVKAETQGRVDTQFFPNSQLGGDAAMLSQLRLGATQFMLISPANLAPFIPAIDIVNLGFAFNDTDQGARAIEGPFGDYLRGEIAAKGLSALDLGWDLGMQEICAGPHAIRLPDDLRGFKIRVPASRITLDLFKGLEASPTPISLAETYTALQTKLIDGTTIGLISLELFGYYAVQKFASLTHQNWGCLWVAANGEVWKGLPPDLQATIARNAKKYGAMQRRDIKVLSIAMADKLARQGMAINTVDPAPFRARLHAYYATWAKEFGPTGWGLFEAALGRKLA